MKFSDKLMANYNARKMTVVRREDGDYCIFSTLDFQGDLKATGWFGSVERALKSIGGIMGWEAHVLDEWAKTYSWQIIKTIDFSELGGKGYELGCKVRVIATGEVGHINSFFGGGYFVGPDPHYRLESVSTFRHPKEIEPYFEDEHECEEDWVGRCYTCEKNLLAPGEEVPTMNLSERLDMIDRKIGIIFEELGITELKCGILSKKKS